MRLQLESLRCIHPARHAGRHKLSQASVKGALRRALAYDLARPEVAAGHRVISLIQLEPGWECQGTDAHYFLASAEKDRPLIKEVG